ncbi:MAG: hypothetical protein NTV46_01005 [Verrucomicrobia bacterium]|nr:hypothetical protein [Verrucomicrobiota bacterium]
MLIAIASEDAYILGILSSQVDLKWGTGGPPVISSAHGQAARAPLEAAAALEQQLLCRLVALNHERAAEEKRGIIRWLRPDYQNPVGRGGLAAPTLPVTEQLALTDDDDPQSTIRDPQSLPVWPAKLPAQVAALRKLLPTIGQDPETGPAELAERLADCFGRKNKKRAEQITAILDTLKALGHIA